MARRGFIECPECGSSRVKTVGMGGFRDFVLLLSGAYRFRCSHCTAKFYHRPLGPKSVTWAKCPKCLRLDLSSWDIRMYRAPFRVRLKLWLGAHPWRCERCRHNFASFRARKERYVRPAVSEEVTEER